MQIHYRHKLTKHNGQRSAFSLAVFLSLILHGVIFLLWAILAPPETFFSQPAPLLLLEDAQTGAPKAKVPALAPVNYSKVPTTLPAQLQPTHQVPVSSESEIKSSRVVDLNVIAPILPSQIAPAASAFSQRIRQAEKPIASIFPLTQSQEKFLMKQVEKLYRRLHQIESDTILVWRHQQEKYQVKISKPKDISSTGLEKIIFEITTEMNGQPAQTRLKMQRRAFSSYAQFVDEWDPKIMLHNDELYGRFHSNSSIRISQFGRVRPRFHGKVTTASFEVKTDKNTFFLDESSIFSAGLERGVRSIHLPEKLSALLEKKAIDPTRIQVFNKETWVSFLAEGAFSWTANSDLAPTGLRRMSGEDPFFILGKSNAKIHVKGVVNGQILVLVENDLIIDGDLMYAHSLEDKSSCDDFLGLVSHKDIKIAPQKVTGKGDLCVCAAIYAHRNFEVTNLYGKGEAILYLFGSLSARTISATEPRYATRIVFDPRLERQRPPYFPQTDQYELISWNRLWLITKRNHNEKELQRK